MKIFLAITVAAACGVFIYAVAIEPFLIEVTHHSVSAPIHTPLKIAHLTDLHTKGIGRREEKLLSILDVEKPDIIVVTGDTNSGGANYGDCRKLLSRFKAPFGVFLVRGNWENWFPLEGSEEHEFYRSLGVTFLLNENTRVNDEVSIVGLDEMVWGQSRPEAAFKGIDPKSYTIALFHSPAEYDEVSARCNLAFTGHSHGGQICLPFIGSVWLPRGCGSYVKGWYSKGDSKMYVSRGLGTSILPMRLLSRPEVAFFYITPRALKASR